MPVSDKSYKRSRGIFLVADEFGIHAVHSDEGEARKQAHHKYSTEDVFKYSVWVIWYELDTPIGSEIRFHVLGKYPRSQLLPGQTQREELPWSPSEDGWDEELNEKTFLP